MAHVDTIVAPATPAGRGGVAIVRVSGPRTPEIAATLLGDLPPARQATLASFPDARGEPIDVGIALFFPGPHSYTGEHVLELQGHGGPVVVEALVARVVALGARRAQPGEFTLRAFLNDKIDLAQAEAVADLIDAGSTDAARAAMRSLQGEFSTMVAGLTEAVIETRVYVEAAIDFPEEEVDFLADTELSARLAQLRAHFAGLLTAAQQGRLLRDGMTVVLAGRPNAGKSSLLNRLAGYDAAIVTPIPGTTRDVVREQIAIDGMPLHVLDTAGLRAAQDAVEQEGVRRAHAEMARADRVLFVIDSEADPDGAAFMAERESLPADVPVTLVFNKIDLVDAVGMANTISGPMRLAVSAVTGQGIDALRGHLKHTMQFQSPESGSVSARQRHIDALTRAEQHVEAAVSLLSERRAGELMAEELRAAQRALDEITGVFSSDDLLGRIFGSFCIGK
ncbi:MAG TPA: tRNA uridine-5-carboxymethylaminomethyl(34) synthesis GTPase MnmE [Steroidobacteraceae bacterium]|nr:tRNA uridine-5-carboxymethylaminomethyl(34) synthesis GTPase MnmE [Steroidobacteraceae bacterium]HRX88416.1 tRNA uridine-5-carboxymethylaminomethyl(34) synthesis GTPase MnmE [Steroidobacteraceae bacterium]